MNEFTKEELGILSRALTCYVGENAGKDIQNKLLSMIENYCEHEDITNYANGVVCQKCNQTWETR